MWRKAVDFSVITLLGKEGSINKAIWVPYLFRLFRKVLKEADVWKTVDSSFKYIALTNCASGFKSLEEKGKAWTLCAYACRKQLQPASLRELPGLQ